MQERHRFYNASAIQRRAPGFTAGGKAGGESMGEWRRTRTGRRRCGQVRVDFVGGGNTARVTKDGYRLSLASGG